MTSAIMAQAEVLASRKGGSGTTSNPVVIIIGVVVFIAIVVAVLGMKRCR